MHENRETSSLTARKRSSPAGEGLGRTSGMNGGEESDRVVLPMKRANKALENIRWSGGVRGGKDANQGDHQSEPHAPGTVRDFGMSRGLAGVRQRQL